MNFTVPDLPLTRPAAISTMSPTPICFRVASYAAVQAFLESAPPYLPPALQYCALLAMHMRSDVYGQDMANPRQSCLKLQRRSVLWEFLSEALRCERMKQVQRVRQDSPHS